MNPYISMDRRNCITFGLVTQVPWPIVNTLNAKKYITYLDICPNNVLF